MERNDNLRDLTIPKIFRRNVNHYLTRVALREKNLGIWKRISWNDYWEHVRNFALGLKELGLKENEERVSILADNCPEWLYADIANQSCRAISVGIYPTNAADQVKYGLENSESRLVVCGDQEQVDKVLEVQAELPLLEKIIVIDTKGLRNYSDPKIISFAEVEKLGMALHEKDPGLFHDMIEATLPEDTAIMVYTSGTTGEPKGALITHYNLLSMFEGLRTVTPFGEKDSFVSALPLCHVAERLFSMVFPMCGGCTVNFAESIQTLQEDIREISPTAFLSVPRIFEKMHSDIYIKMKDAFFLKRWLFNSVMPIGQRIASYRLEGQPTPLHWRALYGLGYLLLFRVLKNKLGLLNSRIVVSGVAPISTDLLKFFQGIGVPIREAYGMTESAGLVFMPEADEVRMGRVGRPIPGIEYKFAEDGELMLRGDTIFKGYYRKSETTTAAITKDGWLKTGDVGQIAEDGQLEIVDRKKDIFINAYGKNLSPSEIENKLKFSPYIKEAIIFGDGRKYLTALIQIELENVSDWVQDRGIAFTTYRSLAENPEIYGLIQDEVNLANKSLSRVEQVKRFSILTKELDQGDDEVTPTMKVRRAIILEKFKDIIEKMY